MITYRTGNDLSLDEAIELYVASTLGERRPVSDRVRMQRMLAEANLVITAWDGPLMVGIARSMSDYAFATYISDLAVRLTYQRQGIGVELMRRTQSAAPLAKIILLAAPAAETYYPKVGMAKHHSAWTLDADARFRE